MFILYFIITCIITVYLTTEFLLIYLMLRKVPIRILINGTRGKTTTVKILHQVLNQSGRMTFSKTTGDLPELHYPDGSRKQLFRFGPANIKENIFQLLNWVRYKPEIFVMESMALHPEMQHTLSHKIFRPTHLGITNIKKDHMEIMGTDDSAIFNCVARSFTPGSRKYLPQELKDNVTENILRKPKFIYYSEESFPRRYPLIPQTIIEANWGLIKNLGKDLELDLSTLTEVFEKEWEELNRHIKFDLPAHNLEFFNLFSMNDLETTVQFIEHVKNYSSRRREIVLINTRADRPLRGLTFADYFKTLPWISEFWLAGKGKYLLKRQLNRDRPEITANLFSDATALVNRINRGFHKPTRIYGLANHQGMDILLDNLRELS
ncbi:MAG: hypothetical protein JSW33_08215 [bacterium]|nr:MAG: hypothetical protein JSW33_08215 [bacterium]